MFELHQTNFWDAHKAAPLPLLRIMFSLPPRRVYSTMVRYRPRMRYRKHLSSLTLSSLLFLVIGTGNVVMGYRKGIYFEEAALALQQRQLEMGTSDPVLKERLESKKSFYQIVSIGGIGLLCVSAILLGLDVVRRRRL